jgi:hypothetical protein
VREEAESQLPLSVGEIAVTSAGRLPAKYILHAITVDWKKKILPTDRTLRRLAREILVRCEALRIRRIAIPALATGAADFSFKQSAEIIVGSLFEHLINPSSLQTVFLPVPSPVVRKAFLVALALYQQESSEIRLGSKIVAQYQYPLEEEGEEESDLDSAVLERVQGDTGEFLASFAVQGLAGAEENSRPVLDGRYVLLEEIGRGGMGVVFLCWDLVLRHVLAIKTLNPLLSESDILKQEASIALNLTHEGIVRVHHFEPACQDSEPYLVMEYLPWPSGEKWIADAGVTLLPWRTIAEIGICLSRALDYAHRNGVLHLDIKPPNLFVDSAGEQAKLADFGLSRARKGPGLRLERAAHLQVGVTGTVAYMAPEQTRSGAKLGPATDVYQLAATLWDLTVGRPPQAKSEQNEARPDCGPLLKRLGHAMDDDPAKRPSIQEFEKMLKEVVQD